MLEFHPKNKHVLVVFFYKERRCSLRLLRHLPLVLFVVLVWAILRLAGVDLGRGNFLSWVINFACIVLLVFEFYKSGDIGLAWFQIDLASAVVSLVVTTAFMTAIWQRQTFFFVDIIVGGLVLIDAYFSPFNSFRTALRNTAIGVDTPAPDTTTVQ